MRKEKEKSEAGEVRGGETVTIQVICLLKINEPVCFFMSCVPSLILSVVVSCWVGLCSLVLSLCPYLLSCFRVACFFLGFVVCPNHD